MSNDNLVIFSLIGIIFILLGLLSGFVVFFYLKQREAKSSPKQAVSPTEVIAAEEPKTVTEDVYCAFHEKEEAKGTCIICEASCCEKCLKEWEGLYFCPEHLKTYSENLWVDITNIKTTPDKPEAAAYIYKFKGELWIKEGIPTYIVTHYKINVEGDFIESYVMLYVRDQDKDLITKRLNKIN